MAVRIPLIVDYNGKGLERLKREFAQLDGVAAKSKFVLQKAFLPATAALGALGAVAKSAIDDAADLNEGINKLSVVMGDASAEALRFADNADVAFGLSKIEAINAASTFAIFGKSAGLAGDDLADFSLDFTRLAVDLASFNNTTPEEAITAIGAALRGEAEPLRRFGVLLDDATLRQEALALGIITSTKTALTPQQKVLAAQAAIYKQTADAQGDFERTSGSVVNRQKILTARMKNFRTEVGLKLLPVFEKLLPIVEGFADWASRNKTLITVLAAAFGALSAAVVVLNFVLALNPFVAIAAAIAAIIAGLVVAYQRIEGFRNLVDGVFGFIRRNWDLVLTAFTGPLGAVIVVWRRFGDKIIEIFGFVRDMIVAAFTGIAGLFTTIINGILGGVETLINGAVSPINGLIRGANKVPFVNIPEIPKIKIPKLAEGGIVSQATLAVIGEAGPEAVIPLDKLGTMGGGTTNVTINVSGADPQAVVNALVRWSRQNGTLPSVVQVA